MRSPVICCIRLSLRPTIYRVAQPSVRLRGSRPPVFKTPHLRPISGIQRHSSVAVQVQASNTSYILCLLVACGSAFAYEYFTRAPDLSEVESSPIITEELPPIDYDRQPAYDTMPIPEGSLGNLTAEQEAKLREFWSVVLKTYGVTDPDHPNGVATPELVQTSEPPKPKRRSFFSRGKAEEPVEEDKYGQTAELQNILQTVPAETLRSAFWTGMKADHPDQLMLRFLRARKWDVQKAMAMLTSTMNWRSQVMHVDDDIMLNGEAGALADSKTADTAAKKDGEDFLAQAKMGKSFIHGADKDGRPMTYVRVRLHRGGEQSERAMERYTVWVIETARLTLRAPVETGTIVFDMTNFTLANMDYTPVKFIIKVFEANYPESLGFVLVHKAPWVFNAVWKIIRGWLDPVVAAKIHFTNTVEEMEAYVPRNQIISDLGGDEFFEYKYVEEAAGENDVMKDTATRDKLRAEREETVTKYQNLTFKWIAAAGSKEESDKLWAERNALATALNDNYWHLDPYVRARSLYDRVGMIRKGGKIDYYPKHTLKTDAVNGEKKSSDEVHVNGNGNAA